jgi:hypothetical protein
MFMTRADSFARLSAEFSAMVNSSGDLKHHIITRGAPLACYFLPFGLLEAGGG